MGIKCCIYSTSWCLLLSKCLKEFISNTQTWKVSQNPFIFRRVKARVIAGKGKAVLPFYFLASALAINSKISVHLLQDYKGCCGRVTALFPLTHPCCFLAELILSPFTVASKSGFCPMMMLAKLSLLGPLVSVSVTVTSQILPTVFLWIQYLFILWNDLHNKFS